MGRSFFVVRVLSVTVACLLVALVCASCGRSNLDDYLPPDGGIGEGGADTGDALPPGDGGACNATTCPTGCCDAAGHCQLGTSATQCGSLGEVCQNCSAEGFQLCDATRHACGNPVATCNAGNCAGCCEGNVCFAGSDPNECGFSGQTCQHCASQSLTCSAQRCVKPACGPGNCDGCCFGDQCIAGTDQTACGVGGQVCGNCQGSGGKCVPQGSGGVCEGQTTCGPSNCKGCCSGTVCLSGTSQSACGVGGQACTSCTSVGETCFPQGPTGGVCQPQTGCNPSTCPGCCSAAGCQKGVLPNACGSGGQICTDCTQQGETCVSQGGVGGFCQPQTGCDPTNCKGCCDQNGACVPGTSSSACGVGGGFCTDCSFNKGTCSGGLCLPPPPSCDATTCPKGCCDANKNCLPGDLDSFCGTGGKACTDCTTSNETCKGSACIKVAPTCNASNCTGCCDPSNTCQAGFIDTQCGQGGASCEDCTTIVPASTCDVGVTPRTCASQQTQCPAPYASCPGSLETPSHTQEQVCTQSDLQNAASACTAGAHTNACNSFFAFEQQHNAKCASCLKPFDYDFQELQGLTTCAAPFVDATCNHITACLVDCTDVACAKCADPGAQQACQTSVPGGECAPYYNGAQCIGQAFFGPGSFCDPNQGSGLFGDWLAAVGQYYCAQ